MKVLVVGASGNVGTHLIGELRRLRIAVRAFVREGVNAPPRTEPGAVEVVFGDLADRASLERAILGCDAAFLTSPHSPAMLELHKNLIDAARQIGVRVVRLAGWTPSITPDGPAPGGRGHWLVERHLIGAGVPYSLLHVNYFMQNLVVRNATVIRNNRILAGPLGDARISMIDAADVGAAAAHVLAKGEHAAEVYTLTGPSAVSYADVAGQLTSLLGRHVRYVDMDPVEFRRWMLASGRQPWEADHALALFAIYRAGGGEDVTPDFERLVGRPPAPLADYLARNRHEFTVDRVSDRMSGMSA